MINQLIIRELIQRFPYTVCEYTDTDRPLTLHGSLYIYTGHSDRTIYPVPSVNWQFRAHHDTLHRQSRLGFSFEEEKAVTQLGITALGLQCSPQLADVYWADNVGQQEYYRQHGQFPDDQARFVYERLSR